MTPSDIFGAKPDILDKTIVNPADQEGSCSESTPLTVNSKTINRGRPTNAQRLNLTKSDSCPSIINYLDTKRKREPEEQHKDNVCPATKKTNVSTVSPSSTDTDITEDSDMDKILSELAAMRKDQEKKHSELTKRMEDNFKKIRRLSTGSKRNSMNSVKN